MERRCPTGSREPRAALTARAALPNGLRRLPPCSARRNRNERGGRRGLVPSAPARGQPGSPAVPRLRGRAARPPPAVSCPCLLSHPAALLAATARGKRPGARPPSAPASGRSQRRAPGPRRRLGGAGSERAMKSPREAGEPPPGQCGHPAPLRPAGPLRAGGGGEAESARQNGPGTAPGGRRGAGGERGPCRSSRRPPGAAEPRLALSSDGELPAPSVGSGRRELAERRGVRRVIYRHGIDGLVSLGTATAIAEELSVCWETGDWKPGFREQ